MNNMVERRVAGDKQMMEVCTWVEAVKCIFVAGSTVAFANNLDVTCNSKRGIWDDSKDLCPSK